MLIYGYQFLFPVNYLLPGGLAVFIITILAIIISDNIIGPFFDSLRQRIHRRVAKKTTDPNEVLKLVYVVRNDIARGIEDDDIKRWVMTTTRLVRRKKEKYWDMEAAPEIIVRVATDKDIYELQRLTCMYNIPSYIFSNSVMFENDTEYAGIYLGPIRRAFLNSILSYVKVVE